VLSSAAYGGRLDLQAPLRVLVAGGGTGDAALLLADQLRRVGNPGRVTYLDLSTASRRIAEERASRFGLDNIDFHTGSLLEVGSQLPGPYDYINCSGVLHHLPEPEEGARALSSVLAPEGVLGAMVYGTMGRIGVYQAQQLLRTLSDGLDLPEQVALTRRVLGDNSPPWLARNEAMQFADTLSDAEIMDRYLHPQDRSYTVPELIGLMEAASLQIVSLVPALLYEPRLYAGETALERITGLDPWEKASVAELLAGSFSTHSWFAVRSDRPKPEPVGLEPGAVVHLLLPVATELAKQIAGGQLTLQVGHLTLDVEVQASALASLVLQSIDGKITLGGLHVAVQQHLNMEIPWETFSVAISEVLSLLQGAGLVAITRRAT
jgi:SAM-dependent methyltransferase